MTEIASQQLACEDKVEITIRIRVKVSSVFVVGIHSL